MKAIQSIRLRYVCEVIGALICGLVFSMLIRMSSCREELEKREQLADRMSREEAETLAHHALEQYRHMPFGGRASSSSGDKKWLTLSAHHTPAGYKFDYKVSGVLDLRLDVWVLIGSTGRIEFSQP